MKKIYLALIAVFIGGQLMAQNVTSTDNNTRTRQDNQPASRTTGNIEDAKLKELPGFPEYQNTGNKEVDDANYNTAKENWIKENKEIYDSYLASLSDIKKNLKTYKDVNALPGFPKYIDTGNETLDNANFRDAKKKWLKENHQLYIDYINSTK